MIDRKDWQDEIGRGAPDDELSWDAIDTTRAAEARVATGDRRKGREQTYAAIYPLRDGRWCFYRSTPATNGKSWVISPDKRVAENAARNMGEAARLGIAARSGDLAEGGTR